MIGVFDYTSLFTFLGTLCGVGSIYFTLTGNLNFGIFLLLISGFFDSMDGFVARSKKNRTDFEKKYGVQLDSLSDVICFGVAPMILAVSICSSHIYLQILSSFYLLTAISRLAWFNVEEEMRSKKEAGRRKSYTGLCVTPSSIIFPSIYLLKDVFQSIFPYVYFAVLMIVAFLQISKIQVPHLQWKGQLACTIYGIMILILLIIFVL